MSALKSKLASPGTLFRLKLGRIPRRRPARHRPQREPAAPARLGRLPRRESPELQPRRRARRARRRRLPRGRLGEPRRRLGVPRRDRAAEAKRQGPVQPRLLVGGQLHGAIRAIGGSRSPVQRPTTPQGTFAVVKSNRSAVVIVTCATAFEPSSSTMAQSKAVAWLRLDDLRGAGDRLQGAALADDVGADRLLDGGRVDGLRRGSIRRSRRGRSRAAPRPAAARASRSSRSSSRCSSSNPTTTRRRILPRSTTRSSNRPSRSRRGGGAVAALAGAATLRARRVGRLRTVATAVVGVVEARALEVDRGRVQHLLDGRAAFGARGQRVVAHALHHVELMPVRAAVLVDRHAFSIPTLALGSRQCQRWRFR